MNGRRLLLIITTFIRQLVIRQCKHFKPPSSVPSKSWDTAIIFHLRAALKAFGVTAHTSFTSLFYGGVKSVMNHWTCYDRCTATTITIVPLLSYST